MQFNPRKQRLICPYCGAEADAPLASPEAAVVEHDLLSALHALPKQQGYGQSVIDIHCESCGATSTYSEKVQATRCPFCDSPKVRPLTDGAPVIAPESVLPFVVSKADAGKHVVDWLGSGWFRPNDLKSLTEKLKFTGAYLPFWTFDAQTASNWHADAGYYYYETESYTDAQGNRATREIQRTRWEPARGHVDLSFDDVLVLASKGVSGAHIAKVEPFDTQALKPYSADYLAGYLAERYAVDLSAAWDQGRSLIDRAIAQACVREIPGDTHRSLSVQSTYDGLTYKHTLLPVWLGAYRYRDKVYQCVVNGQTGKVAGDVPLSIVKITFAVIFALIALALFIFLSQQK